MVSASQGALVTTDIPTKEYLVWLSNQQSPLNRFGPFVIRVLDDTHLFIRIEAVDFVQQAVKDFNNKNVYTAPADQQ